MQPLPLKSYRIAIRELLEEAIERPEMYMSSLQDFESYLFGYDSAFMTMGFVEREKCFCHEFSDWLYKNKDLSCCSGWAYAIEHQCQLHGEEPNKAFFAYLTEFLRCWSPPAASPTHSTDE